MNSDSPFRVGCKRAFQSQVWIASFDVEEPITKERLLEQVEYLRSVQKLNVRVTLTHRVTASTTRYQEYRTFFDQIHPVVATSCTHPVCPSSSYAVELPQCPDTPQS